MVKVQYVSADDWVGLYVDDVLEWESHSIPAYNALLYSGVNVDHVTLDEDWMYDEGRLPTKFSEIPKEAIESHDVHPLDRNENV